METVTIASPVKEFDEAPRSRVARGLKELIEEGVLKDGQPVPPERVLSEKFAVTRTTVRRALTMMEKDGLLRSQNGKARIVTLNVPQRSRFMDSAIAVLTMADKEPWTQHRQSGWSEYVGHGAIHAVRHAGLHAVALHPQVLRGRELNDLVAERPCGVVITDIHTSAVDLVNLGTHLRENRIPVVIYGGAPELSGFDRVMSDHESGSYLLTQWLADQGCRRMACLWRQPGTGYWFPQRRLGYERAMREAGLPSHPTIEASRLKRTTQDHESWFQTETASLAEQLRPFLTGVDAVDALLLDSDGSVPFVAAACRLLGKEPGHDVALAGYDNYWGDSPELGFDAAPPLVTIDKQNLQMGAELVHLLMDRIGGKLTSGPQSRVVQPKLVIMEPQRVA